MGGEDWADWIDALKAADVLTENAVTVAYSYIGPELTYPIYYHGTIGTAKQHLQKTMSEINQAHPDVCAVISVNKGLVTQASAAIPVVPLYFAILYKVMKKAGNHENCIQQIARLFTQKLYTPTGFQTDENGFIRMDDYELTPEIQEEVKKMLESCYYRHCKGILRYWMVTGKISIICLDSDMKISTILRMWMLI